MENKFSILVDRLPYMSRKDLRDKIELRTGLNLENRWHNWVQGKSRIPPHLWGTVNKIASEVITDLVSDFVSDFEDKITINLFEMDNKTTIKVELAKLNMTQMELANAIGITVATINKIASGKGGVTVKTAQTIAKYFKKEISDFREFQSE